MKILATKGSGPSSGEVSTANQPKPKAVKTKAPATTLVQKEPAEPAPVPASIQNQNRTLGNKIPMGEPTTMPAR
jgi:hypothetical protein